MTPNTRPLTELTEEAIQILHRELGIVDTVRFLRQFSEGFGDYTQERQELYAHETIDSLVDAIRQATERDSVSIAETGVGPLIQTALYRHPTMDQRRLCEDAGLRTLLAGVKWVEEFAGGYFIVGLAMQSCIIDAKQFGQF